MRLNSELWIEISLMEQQFVVTHTTRQTEIPAFLGSWVTNTKFSVKKKKRHLFTFSQKHDMC